MKVEKLSFFDDLSVGKRDNIPKGCTFVRGECLLN